MKTTITLQSQNGNLIINALGITVTINPEEFNNAYPMLVSLIESIMTTIKPGIQVNHDEINESISNVGLVTAYLKEIASSDYKSIYTIHEDGKIDMTMEGTMSINILNILNKVSQLF